MILISSYFSDDAARAAYVYKNGDKWIARLFKGLGRDNDLTCETEEEAELCAEGWVQEPSKWN